MVNRTPTPTQAWAAYERQSLGLSIRAAAQTLGTSRSVMHRAERGGPSRSASNGSASTGSPILLDRLASAAAVEIGSWPAPDTAAVYEVLRWWRQHPLDRLARCLQTRLQTRGDDWQTPLRHFIRELLPLPAVVTSLSALDLLLPPTGRAAPTEWTLMCPWVLEGARVVHRYLGVIDLQSSAGAALAGRAAAGRAAAGRAAAGRAVAFPDRFGRLQADALRVAHPRDLMLTLGWSPGLAAAVRAADLAEPDAMSGLGYPRRMVVRHRSMLVQEAYDGPGADDLGADDPATDDPATDDLAADASGELV